jgi:hypothetical protein
MLKQTITLREVSDPEDASRSQFEVYDSDTGTSLGIYDSREAAQAEVDNMNSSDIAGLSGKTRKQDADPADG